MRLLKYAIQACPEIIVVRKNYPMRKKCVENYQNIPKKFKKIQKPTLKYSLICKFLLVYMSKNVDFQGNLLNFMF